MASIREHARKDGSKSFYVLWRDKDTGKQTSLPHPTRAAAERLKALLDANGQSLAIVERGLEVAAGRLLTVSGLVEWHISQPLQANQDTIEKYKQIHRTHILTQIGSIPAAELTDTDLADWADERIGQGKSRKTLLNVTGLLSAAYTRGVLKGKVPGNPMTGFHLPPEERTTRRATFLTKKEFDLVLSFIPERHRMLTTLLVETGLRFSEATALKPSDLQLDLEVPLLSVTKAWKGKSGQGWRLGPPKTPESVRDVALNSALTKMLSKHVEDIGENYLFRNLRGNPLRNADYHQTGWQKAIDKAVEAGLKKDPRPHDLRHTHASWLLSEGVPENVVSRRLGHANIGTTTKVYGHITPQGHKEAIAGLERALKR